MVRHVLMFCVLFALWMLLSGHTSPLLVSFGVGSCLLVVVLQARMDRTDREVVHLGFRPLAALGYVGWLLWEIVKSNIDVAKVILSRDLPISPTLFRVESTQKTLAGHVLFANSITLTPGTVSINLRRDTILVHALTVEGADGVDEGDMDSRVSALESARAIEREAREAARPGQ
mgnify:FL=1